MYEVGDALSVTVRGWLAKEKGIPEVVTGSLVSQSEKAVCLILDAQYGGGQVWLPFSQVTISRMQSASLRHNGYAAQANLCDDAIPIQHTSAWGHQRKAFWFAKDKPGVMLALDMGCGKSKVTIDLLVNRGHQRVMIICPLTVVDVWPDEFEKHAPGRMRVTATRGSVAQKQRQAEQALAYGQASGKPVAVVINYDSAWHQPFNDWSITAGFDCVVFDELHKAKSPNGVRSRYCTKLAQKVPYRIGLTGTPMPHSPLDIYAQFRALDPTIFGYSFAHFRQRYAVMDHRFPSKVLGYQRENELNSRFLTIAFKVGKEVLDLPPVQHITRYCELSSQARRIYDELETAFYAKVGTGEITVKNALSKLLRLQQVTSGHLPLAEYDETEGVARTETKVIGTEKQDVLEDVLEDIDPHEPVVVFARFTHDLAAIKAACEKLGRPFYENSGQVRGLRAWQQECQRLQDAAAARTSQKQPHGIDQKREQYEREVAPVLGAQIQTMDVGVTVVWAKYCIYYSIGFSRGDYDQSLARIHRPGQTRNVTYIHIMARGTVDEKVYNAIETGRAIVEYVLGQAERTHSGEAVDEEDEYTEFGEVPESPPDAHPQARYDAVEECGELPEYE